MNFWGKQAAAAAVAAIESVDVSAVCVHAAFDLVHTQPGDAELKSQVQ